MYSYSIYRMPEAPVAEPRLLEVNAWNPSEAMRSGLDRLFAEEGSTPNEPYEGEYIVQRKQMGTWPPTLWRFTVIGYKLSKPEWEIR